MLDGEHRLLENDLGSVVKRSLSGLFVAQLRQGVVELGRKWFELSDPRLSGRVPVVELLYADTARTVARKRQDPISH